MSSFSRPLSNPLAWWRQPALGAGPSLWPIGQGMCAVPEDSGPSKPSLATLVKALETLFTAAILELSAAEVKAGQWLDPETVANQGFSLARERLGERYGLSSAEIDEVATALKKPAT